MSINNLELDELDYKIIRILREDATIAHNTIGKTIGLSSSAVNERIRKLKNSSVINKISAIIEAKHIERSLCAYIYVLIDKTSYCKAFLAASLQNENILECHHVTGEYSYLLKVRVKDMNSLENFITNYLKSFKGVTKTFTQIVLSSLKEDSTIIDS